MREPTVARQIRALTRAGLVALVALTGAGMARAEFVRPDSPQSGGTRDIMLCYMSEDGWDAEHFRPYVAWLDRSEADAPRAWLFDGWLFLMYGGAPSGGAYFSGTATASDWRYYVDLLFRPGQNLDALESTIADIGRELDDPDRRCPVIIMIPYLSRTHEHFGDLDGDGQVEDPADPEDRLAAFAWLVDEVLARYEPERYPHLDLWGFCWMYEGIQGANEADVQAVANHVHERGYGLHWIPWHRAAGWDRWRELGIDYAIMQPNFAFRDVPPRMAVPDEERLTTNANLAREHGLGVEMEMAGGVAGDPGELLNLQLYLNHGVDALDGYMNGAGRAWYQSYDRIAALHDSTRWEARRTYDDIHRFHEGTYRRRVLSLCEGAQCTINGRREPRLSDGVWLTTRERPERVVSAQTPCQITVRLPRAEMVGDVRVHVAGRTDGSPGLPMGVEVSTSSDGAEFELAGQGARQPVVAHHGWRAGFITAAFEPRPARAVRLRLRGGERGPIGVDEVVIYPAPGLLWGHDYEVRGRLAADCRPREGDLTDGRLLADGAEAGGVAFEQTGTVRFALGEEAYLARALAHARWSGGERPGVRVSMDEGAAFRGDPAEAAGEGEGWATVELPTVPARAVSFELSGGPSVTWDELQLCRADNLAQGMPYEIDPPFESKYPDTGGTELTDGELSEGFGDGGTVGWYWSSRLRTVVIDLGEPAPLTSVRAHVQGGGYAAVNYPDVMDVWGSADGERWRLLAVGEPERRVVSLEMVGDERSELAWLTQQTEPVAARLVKLRFRNTGWLMLSEIEVLAGDENVARGRPYHLVPPPTSQGVYPDTGMMLTDGGYARSPGDWHSAVGWNHVDPRITIDLLAPREVAIVRVHCLGGGAGAVYFPASIAVSTSEDGDRWSAETVITDHPAEGGDERLSGYMQTRLEPRGARWVRLQPVSRGWTMIDEIEILGP